MDHNEVRVRLSFQYILDEVFSNRFKWYLMFLPVCCLQTLNKIDLDCSFELGEPGELSRTTDELAKKVVQVCVQL